MKKSTGTIIFLVIALLGTNAWWLYTVIDAGVTATYREVTHRENKEALDQTLAIIPVITGVSYTKEKVIEAARHPYLKSEPFEKEGYIWVGRIGLSFSETGKLYKIKRSWE